jgi:hypothetical protein
MVPRTGLQREQSPVMATYVCAPRDLAAEPATAPTLWRTAQRAIGDYRSRRAHTPAALGRLARLAPDERPLVVACDLGDATVVATNAALHGLGAPEGAGEWSRWGWEEISRIEWDEPTSSLTLTGQEPLFSARIMLTLPAPGPLVDLARERIAWTIQLATRVGLSCGGTVRVVVRRQPVTDRMDWYVYPDATIITGDASVRTELQGVLATLRADTGL